MRRGELIRQSGTDDWMVYVPESDSLHTLNQTARAIWELCDGQITPGEMAEAIAELTGFDSETSRIEVELALERLRRSGLIDG